MESFLLKSFNTKTSIARKQATACYGNLPLFSYRTGKEIARAQRFRQSVLDSFYHYGKECGILRASRRLFMVSLSNHDMATKFYKSFAEAIRCHLACLDVPDLERTNPLRTVVSRITCEPVTKKFCEKAIYLCATRHLPLPTEKKKKEALNDFKNLISTPFEVPKELLDRVHRAAENLGTQCKTDGPKEIHVSLGGAGTLDTSVAEGGRTTEVMRDLTAFLSGIPTEDEVHSVLGHVSRCPMGQQRWKTYCLSPKEQSDVAEMSTNLQTGQVPDQFLQPLEADEGFLASLGWQGLGEDFLPYKEENTPFRSGLNCYFGRQAICRAAQLVNDSEQSVRVSQLPEGGGKVRTITMNSWENNFVQTAVGKQLMEFLETHPRMVSIFTRQNQAWYMLYLLHKRDYKLNSKNTVLTSDFSSATDAIPKPLARSVLDGFAVGLGIEKDPLFQLAKESLVCEKAVFHGSLKDPQYLCRAKRGIFMGEPLTKVVLTILMQVLDMLALEESEGGPVAEGKQPKWWFFFAPGDDFIAMGKERYINALQRLPTELGLIINKSKTKRTNKGSVYFCEQAFWVDGFKSNPIPPKQIAKHADQYAKSAWIDFIKLKLYTDEPLDNKCAVSERNVLFGKASAFGKALRWLHSEVMPFSEKKEKRDYFLKRMVKNLPKSYRLQKALLLPPKFGGLDLHLGPDEAWDIYSSISDEWSLLVKDSLTNKETQRMLQRYNSQRTFRGYEIPSGFEVLIDYFTDFFFTMFEDQVKTTFELITERGWDIPIPQAAKLLRKEGWLDERGLQTMLERPIAFSIIFSGKAEFRPYRTTSFEERFKPLWQYANDELTELLSMPELDKILKSESEMGVQMIQAGEIPAFFKMLPAMTSQYRLGNPV